VKEALIPGKNWTDETLTLSSEKPKRSKNTAVEVLKILTDKKQKIVIALIDTFAAISNIRP